MAEFKKIGTGINTKTKKGTNAIRLTLDKDAQQLIQSHDFENAVWLFESVNKNGKKYWSVTTPMPDDYQINYDNLAKHWQKKFEDKHKDESDKQFTDWLEK